MLDIAALLDPEISVLVPLYAGAEYSAKTLAALRERPLVVDLPPLSDRVTRVDHVVPGDPDVVVRVHRPVDVDGDLPCVYAIHGGGYVRGDYSAEDARFDSWCQRLACVGVSVQYRLAPETPYPGALEDCYAGLAWTHAQASQLGVDRTRIGIMGVSAGGGLAAGLALLARDRAGPPIAFQLLVYPMLDDRQTSASSQWEVPIWSPAANRFGWQSYLGDLYGSDHVPIYAAPSRAVDLAGLPPGFIMVGTLDGFLDEDVDYAQRLNRAGVPTELHVYPGAPHGFDGMMASTAVARRARREVLSWVERQLSARRG
jgi:triacylglycerol lipase